MIFNSSFNYNSERLVFALDQGIWARRAGAYNNM